MKIKELLLQSGAQVAFALTTPVPIAGRRNKRVVKYNKEARRYERKFNISWHYFQYTDTILAQAVFAVFFYFMNVSKRTSRIVISQHDENFARFCKTCPSYISYMRNVNSW